MNFQKLSIKMVTVLLTLSFGVTAPLCFAAEPLQPLSQSQQKQPTEGPSIVPSTPVDLVGATKTEPAKVNGFNDSPLSPASDDGEGVKTQAVSTKTEATSQPAISGASEAKKEGQAIGTQASGEQSQEPGSLSDSQVLKEMPKVNSDIPLTFDEKMIIQRLNETFAHMISSNIVSVVHSAECNENGARRTNCTYVTLENVYYACGVLEPGATITDACTYRNTVTYIVATGTIMDRSLVGVPPGDFVILSGIDVRIEEYYQSALDPIDRVPVNFRANVPIYDGPNYLYTCPLMQQMDHSGTWTCVETNPF